MSDRMLPNTQSEIQFFTVVLAAANPHSEPLQVSARDFGYEIDEQEMAEELIAPIPISLSTSNLPEVAPNDFESIYGWFLS